MSAMQITKRVAIFLIAVPFALAGCGGKKKSGGSGAGGGSSSGTGGNGSGTGSAGNGQPTAGGDIPVAPARGAEHAVFSLTDNRLLSHLHIGGGLVIDAASPGLAKYLHMGKPRNWWSKQEVVDGKRATLIDNYAPLEFPLDEAEAAGKTIWVRMRGEGAGRNVTLEIGGKSITQPIPATWTTVAFALPDGALKAGENVLRLIYTKGAPPAVAWVQIGGAAALPDDAALAVHDVKDGALLLGQGAALSYYVMVPKGGLLAGDVPVAGCALDVKVRPSAGGEVTGKLTGKGSAVDLGGAAGKIARLDITNASCPAARLTGAALVVGGAAPTVARPSKPKNIVLWINDSLRADRIKLLNPGTRVESPIYDSLGSKAAWFKNAYVQGNESRASHASIWTSTFPSVHRVIKAGVKVDAAFTTIDEVMKSASLFTSAVTSNGYITPAGGFGSKWDAYHNNIHDGGGVRGEDVMGLGIKSIKTPTSPFFLYLGLIDNHVSWRAKQPWMDKYDPEPYTGPYKTELAGIEAERITGKVQVAERDKQRVIAIYDSNVSYADDLMGKFLAQLETWGVANDTLIVMTGDHGDELWEDGLRIGHGASLRESLVHVPLMILYPPLFPAGVIEEGVDTVDILPTLADALGIEAPPELQGESLVPLAQGVGRGYPRPAFASKYEDAHVMRLGGWKLYAGGANTRLYEIDADPEERKDLAADRPIERRFVMDPFSTFLIHQKDWKKRRWGVASNALPAFAADLESGK